MKSQLLSGTSAICLLVSAPMVAAQDSAQDETILLEVINVSGAKREQDAQSFPGNVAQVDNTDLENRTVRDVSDLQKVFGGVYIDKRSSRIYTNITVRGQSSLDFYNPSVQLYVDGVPQDAGMFDQMLPFGIDTVELLYGPQGTLYGRGAIGGVLNINTLQPGEGPRFAFDLDYGSGQQAARGQGEVQLGADLWADLALSYQKEDNDLTLPDNTEVGGSTAKGARFRLRYAPEGSPLDITFSAQRQEVVSDEEYFVMKQDWDSRTALPYPSHYEQDTNTYALNLTYDMGWGDFTSTTSYQDRDLDRTIYGYYTPETQKTTTQEFRLSSDANSTLKYVVGLMFQKGDFSRQAYGATVNIKTQTAALFGDLTWSVTDRLDISPGVRFDYEKSDVEAHGYGTFNTAQDSWNDISPKLGFSYALQDGLQLYGLYSTGVKAGGFSRNATPSVAILSYDPQKTNNVEAGLKFASADGSLSASLAAYYTQSKDYQMFVGTAPLQYLQNVGEVVAKGLDAQVNYHKNDWGFTASAGYVDSQFTDYSNPLSPTDNLTGNQVPYVPNVTLNLLFYKTFALNNGRSSLTPRIGLTYQSEVWFDETNTVSQDPVTLVDAGVAWEMQNGAVLDFYVTNLTNEDYAEYGFNAGFANAYTLGRGREVGIQLRKSF